MIAIRHRFSLLVAGATTLVAACADGTATAPGVTAPSTDALALSRTATRESKATAELHDVAGERIGTARFTEDATGRVHLTVHVRGVTPGLHGLHLHATGACDGAGAFASAGAHYNPGLRQHGHHNPLGYHAGDLPNVVVNPAGVGHLSVPLEQFTLAALADADGTAIVLHQNEDDGVTNSGPAGPGNSGARIGCGVVQP